MLGHRYVAGGNHQRDGGRDVQAVLPVAARAANVDRAGRGGDGLHPGTHRPHGPGHFGSGFTALGQVNQRGGDGIVRQFAVEHPAEQRFGFVQGHASSRALIPQMSRKLASMA